MVFIWTLKFLHTGGLRGTARSHTQHVRRSGPHLLGRNAVGGAAKLVSNFGNDRSAAGFAKKGKCRPCWSCLDYFDFFSRTVFAFTTSEQIVRPQQIAQPCRRTWAPKPGPSTKMIMNYTRWLVCDRLLVSVMFNVCYQTPCGFQPSLHTHTHTRLTTANINASILHMWSGEKASSLARWSTLLLATWKS